MPALNLEEALVGLYNMAEKLNDAIDLEDDIAELTPYAWWRRNKENDLPIPMPKPETVIGGNSPLWRIRDIERWYRAWKGLG